jgi:hypothetical protein
MLSGTSRNSHAFSRIRAARSLGALPRAWRGSVSHKATCPFTDSSAS